MFKTFCNNALSTMYKPDKRWVWRVG